MSSMAANNSDLRAQRLLSSYMRAGYTPIDPPVLQPAEPFLDLSGEDIRRRMFLTSDPHGRELCLRPDLTIPVSRAYLQSPDAGKPGNRGATTTNQGRCGNMRKSWVTPRKGR